MKHIFFHLRLFIYEALMTFFPTIPVGILHRTTVHVAPNCHGTKLCAARIRSAVRGRRPFYRQCDPIGDVGHVALHKIQPSDGRMAPLQHTSAPRVATLRLGRHSSALLFNCCMFDQAVEQKSMQT